jgi:hypothetical protein
MKIKGEQEVVTLSFLSLQIEDGHQNAERFYMNNYFSPIDLLPLITAIEISFVAKHGCLTLQHTTLL